MRKVRTTEIDAPSALRSEPLQFLDTAMLLVLRQLLLAAPGEQRVIVGQEDVYERLAVYRDGDESVFLRNLNGAWGRMLNRYRVLHPGGADRAEISPMVKFLIDEDRISALSDLYARIAAGTGADTGSTPATIEVSLDSDESAVDLNSGASA